MPYALPITISIRNHFISKNYTKIEIRKWGLKNGAKCGFATPELTRTNLEEPFHTICLQIKKKNIDHKNTFHF